MVKEKRILSYILGWLIVGFIIIFMGVNNVFAASYNADNFTAQIYDNINGSLTAKTTTKESSGAIYYYSYDVGYTAYSSGGAWGVSSPIPLLANHTYSMTVDPMVIGCGFTILSSINRIGVGTSLGNAVLSYQNNTNVNEKLSQAVSNSRYLQYVFTPTINASYIVFPYSTTSSCSGRESQLTSIVIEDLGESGVSQDQINTSLNNQTNELNNSIQNSTDTIINNQNQNNEELKDTINENFNSCRQSYNLLPNIPDITRDVLGVTVKSINNEISVNGTATGSGGRLNAIMYFTLSAGSYKLVLTNNINSNLFLSLSVNGTAVTSSNGNDVIFSLTDVSQLVLGVNVLQGQTYNDNFKVMIVKSDENATDYEPYGEEICSNKIDETNDKLDGIQGALTDSSSPNLEILGDSAGWLPPGPLDSVLNLPLTMMNNLLTNLGRTCSTLRVELPFVNRNIEIPCVESLMEKMNALILWRWVGRIASVIILYSYLMNLYAWADKILTLRAEFDEAMGVDLANWGRL